MQILYPESALGVILGQILHAPLCEGRYKHPLLGFDAFFYLSHEIVNLSPRVPYLYGRVNEACGPYYLLYDHSARFSEFVFPGSGRDEYRLLDAVLEFLELKRPVVE